MKPSRGIGNGARKAEGDGEKLGVSIREIENRLKSISGLIQARYAHELVILDFEKRLDNDLKFAKWASTLVAEAKSSLGEMATLNAITTWIQTERATPIKARASARLFVQRHGGTAPDELKRVIDIMSTCLEQVEKSATTSTEWTKPITRRKKNVHAEEKGKKGKRQFSAMRCSVAEAAIACGGLSARQKSIRRGRGKGRECVRRERAKAASIAC